MLDFTLRTFLQLVTGKICKHIIHIWQSTYKPNTLARSRNHCCRGKASSITYYKRVCVALVIQHTTRMRSVTSPSVACLDSTVFLAHYLMKVIIFGEKKLCNTKCVF